MSVWCWEDLCCSLGSLVFISYADRSGELAAVVDGKLYIDGGTLWLSPKGKGLKSTREISIFTHHKLLQLLL